MRPRCARCGPGRTPCRRRATALPAGSSPVPWARNPYRRNLRWTGSGPSPAAAPSECERPAHQKSWPCPFVQRRRHAKRLPGEARLWMTGGRVRQRDVNSWTKGLVSAGLSTYGYLGANGGAARTVTGSGTGESTRLDTRPTTRPGSGNVPGAGVSAGSSAGLSTGSVTGTGRGSSSVGAVRCPLSGGDERIGATGVTLGTEAHRPPRSGFPCAPTRASPRRRTARAWRQPTPGRGPRPAPAR